MRSPLHFAGDTLATAALATAATTLTTALLGQRELGHPAAPLNATSHIVWGDDAARHDRPDTKHTLVGAALNAGAMVAWAGVLEATLGPWARRGSLLRAAVAGAAVSALAYATDYHLVPRRFTPGFEKRLSGRALAVTYGALALSLAGGVARRG